MPFYIRKSVSMGPFRFNLSKSGIGVSAGIKGLRIGTGPKGHYIHAGRGGLYYRSSIGSRPGSQRGSGGPGYDNGAEAPLSPVSPREPRPAPAQYYEPNVQMVPVSSEDVLQMQDTRFADVLVDLKAKQSALPLMAIAGWGGGGLTLLAGGSGGPSALAFFGFLTAAAVALGWWLDSSKRSSVLMYDLDSEARQAYEAMTVAFDVLRGCARIWHVDAGGAVSDIHTWKRNAGASHILDKRPTNFDYSLPRFIKSNITPPAIKSGKETLYFLPDFLLVVDNAKIGAVAYDRLHIQWQDSHFIENGAVPSDTQILYYTWQHPNKSGGPDRRFANNRQVPVCLYESIYVTSPNGLNELLQVSRSGATQPFANAVGRLGKENGSAGMAEGLLQIG